MTPTSKAAQAMTDEQISELASEFSSNWSSNGAMFHKFNCVAFARALLAAQPSQAQAAESEWQQRNELTSLLASHVELNMNNYHDLDVDHLNDWAIRAYTFLAAQVDPKLEKK